MMAQLPSIAIGNLRQEKVYFFVEPGKDDPNDTSTPAFDGLLGQDLFQKVDVDLDYGPYRLSLISQDHCPGKVVYWSAPGPVAVIPFSTDSGNHIILQAELDGRRVKGILDTGATATILNLQSARQIFRLDVNAPDVEKIGELHGTYAANIYRRRFKSLALGGVTVSGPSIELFPDFLNQGAQAAPIGSLIKPDRQELPDMIFGMSIISKLHVYIANREHKLYITAAGGAAELQPELH
jgi:hypothetical protein